MPLFTRENAAILGKRGAIARWTPKPPAPILPPVPEPLPADQFQSRRLARVRAQLDLIDAAITLEAGKHNSDGQRLNWLASAQERLAEQEGWLANRAKPGSLRPTGPGRRGSPVGWDTMEHVAPTLPTETGINKGESANPVKPAVCNDPARPMGWEYDPPPGDTATGSVPPPALPLP